MAVRLRMKQMGRRHRPFYRVCAMDSHSPRDGRVLEELGTYDPSVPQIDARAILNSERIDYWLGVGAQPTEKVKVLIKKYGTEGTHLDQQKSALDQLAQPKLVPEAGKPASVPKKEEEAAPEAATETTETPAADATTEAPAAAPAEETPATEAAETPAKEEASAEAAKEKKEDK